MKCTKQEHGVSVFFCVDPGAYMLRRDLPITTGVANVLNGHTQQECWAALSKAL